MSGFLIGCHSKLQRAQENIQNLRSEISAFFSQEPKPYRIVREFRNEGRRYAFVAFSDCPVPPRFAVLAGEIVHHLRSSLDHLLCALVIKNGGSPTRRHQFPIYTSKKQFDDACARGILDGITDSAKTIIRSVQPYVAATPDDTVLHVVQQYNNIDKHQLLIVVSAIARIGNNIRIDAGDKNVAITGLGDPAPRKITDDGAVVFTIDLADPAPNFFAEADFVPQIAFDKCGRVKLGEVIRILTGLHQGTARTIDLFAKEF